MEWIEVIQVKSFTEHERKNVHDILKRITGKPLEEGLKRVDVYLNHILDTDLTISFHWKKPVSSIVKSALGIQLASVFSKFGWIHHTIWECALNVKINEKESDLK